MCVINVRCIVVSFPFFHSLSLLSSFLFLFLWFPWFMFPNQPSSPSHHPHPHSNFPVFCSQPPIAVLYWVEDFQHDSESDQWQWISTDGVGVAGGGGGGPTLIDVHAVRHQQKLQNNRLLKVQSVVRVVDGCVLVDGLHRPHALPHHLARSVELNV